MAEVDAKAQALVAKACGWVASNPDTWAKLRRICYRLMLEGHAIQRDNVYTLACQNGMTVSEASEFKRDHNLWSVLSRYMVLQRPSMLAAVSFRRTPVDSVDLVGTWEAIVGPAVFAASTLTEAQGIYGQGRSMRCTVTVEGRMPSLNDYISAERANRYKAAAMKKRETARVRAAAMQQRAPRFERRVTVRTTFYEPDMRRDADNVGFARKFVLDGLVAAGVIKDDSRKYVEQCPDRVLTDRARPRVVVEASDE